MRCVEQCGLRDHCVCTEQCGRCMNQCYLDDGSSNSSAVLAGMLVKANKGEG